MGLLEPNLSWTVKAGNERMQGPLVDIINLSLLAGIYPEGLKEAVVVPHLKKLSLDPTDITNYCLVSDFLFLEKVIEKVVAMQLQSFLEDTPT